MSIRKHIFIAIILFLLTVTETTGAVNTVILTPSNPTLLSNGLGYYLAGKTYNFAVQVIDPDITLWNQVSEIRITIPNSTGIVIVLTNPTGLGNQTANITSSTGPVNATANITGALNNFTVTFGITILWNTGESVWAALRPVAASATTTNTLPDTKPVSYGICSTIRAVNFSQNGVAADGYVNPWHDSFDIGGTIVYNVPSAAALDAIAIIDPGEISLANQVILLLDGNPAGPSNSGTTTNFSFNVTNAISLSLGDHRWRIRVNMSTAGSPADSPNIAPYYLALNCNRVEISNIEFINGGGTNPPLNLYYRSINILGTQVRVTARLQDNINSPSLAGDLSMRGNTIIRITDGTNITAVQINTGQTSGIGNVTYPAVSSGQTTPLTYQANAILSGALAGDTFPTNGQDTAAEIQQTATYTPQVYWDNNDPPGNNDIPPGATEVPFTTVTATSRTAVSFTLIWTAITALPDPPYDGDFDTYRIYYRESTPPGTWKTVDRTTAGYAALGNPATTTVNITGLIPLTQYDYFITAIDKFGQEVLHPLAGNSDAAYFGAPAGNYAQISTVATSVEITLTDGISQYIDGSFNNVTSSSRPVRKTAIRVMLNIVTANEQPNNVNLILAQDDGSGSTGSDLYAGSGLSTTIPYDKIECSKIGPNAWTAYIPSSNRFLTEGSSCRFIVETVKNSLSAFSDSDSELETVPPGDPNNLEYTFIVKTPTTFTPWPTRVLNNVLTSKNPVCYPAYYLSDDAYVTITAYDIKGRAVATLIDNGFRKGGQNIKEGGWSGENKARKKLGVGLYYLRFEAKRARDGKKILNETEKVVIAK